MTYAPIPAALGIQPPEDVAKVRHCLRCKDSFSSTWSGERICARCKSSNAWRSGIPSRSGPSSSSKR